MTAVLDTDIIDTLAGIDFEKPLPDLWAQFDEKQLKTKSEKKVLAEAKAEAEAILAAEAEKAEESDTETTVE